MTVAVQHQHLPKAALCSAALRWLGLLQPLERTAACAPARVEKT